MARQVRRISDLPPAGPLTGDELLEIVQDGGNKRVTVSMLADGSAVLSVQGRTGNVVITADDVGLGSVDNTSDAGKPVSTAQQAALDGKVDKAAGMGLSSNDFTDPLRDKLIGLEGTHWRGTFVSLAALQAGVTGPKAGDYADVDTVGADVERYIWDATDGIWVVQSGAVAPITASQVKLLYESNPDTNSFTDAEKGKLGGIEAGAQVNTVTSVNSRIGAVTGLVENTDPRLSDSREWAAETVSQVEAEAGTADTRRAWTAQRVRQAIAAWWNSVSSAWGRGFVGSADAAAGRTALGLGSAATATVQTSQTDTTAGRLMAVGAFGNGGLLDVRGTVLETGTPADVFSRGAVSGLARGGPDGLNIPAITGNNAHGVLSVYGHWVDASGGAGSASREFLTTIGRKFLQTQSGGSWGPWREVFTTGNILGTVSQSGGVPTGAIIERGSNANGRFTRYADGTVVMDNSGNAITTNPVTTVGAVTSVDADKLRYGFWY